MLLSSHATATCGWFPDYEAGPVRIVGPNCSGSQGWLSATLRDWQRQPQHKTRFRIISGSATAVQPKVFFNTPDLTFHSPAVPN